MSWISKLIQCLASCHIILRCKSKCCKGCCDSDCYAEEAGDNKSLKYKQSKTNSQSSTISKKDG
jgi:hypothetical protein